MPERTVQVPASLIEEAADIIESDRGFFSTTRRLRALLSEQNAGAQSVKPGFLAPGTMFTATTTNGLTSRWTALNRIRVVSGMGILHPVSEIDLSTIRDVTPPKEPTA